MLSGYPIKKLYNCIDEMSGGGGGGLEIWEIKRGGGGGIFAIIAICRGCMHG